MCKASKYKQWKQQQLYWSQKKYDTCTLHRTTPTFYSKSYSRQAVWVCSTYIVLHLSELNLYYECMKFLKEIKEIKEVKHHVYVKRQTRICTTWSSFPFTCHLLFIITTHTIITFTQEEAIMTSRQTREKLQFLYENVISTNNFRKTHVLKKKKKWEFWTKATQERILLTNFWGRTCALKISLDACLDFPTICPTAIFQGN